MNETATTPPSPTPAAAPAPSAPLGTLWDRLEERFGRRQFLLKVGWGFFWVFCGGWLLSNLRYLFPNVLYEPTLSFKAGKPEEYSLGISEKWKKAQRVWIVREDKGFYCFWARCTHLGCTPNWFLDQFRFKCPCHGSNFNPDGDVIAGPAPKPLWRCKVEVAGSGDLVIDKAVLESREGVRDKAPYFASV